MVYIFNSGEIDQLSVRWEYSYATLEGMEEIYI